MLADPVNRNRYARANVVAKAVELETAHRDVSTPVSALDPARTWRLLSDGTFDSSFGGGGGLIVDFFGSSDAARALALQPDGKIVAAGVARNGTSNGVGLVRINP